MPIIPPDKLREIGKRAAEGVRASRLAEEQERKDAYQRATTALVQCICGGDLKYESVHEPFTMNTPIGSSLRSLADFFICQTCGLVYAARVVQRRSQEARDAR